LPVKKRSKKEGKRDAPMNQLHPGLTKSQAFHGGRQLQSTVIPNKGKKNVLRYNLRPHPREKELALQTEKKQGVLT